MKKILFATLILSAVTYTGIAAVSYSVKDFLLNIQVRTDQLPRAWVRWQTVIPGVYGCHWIDLTDQNVTKAPRTAGWVAVWDYIPQLIATFGNPALTDEQKNFCWGDWPKYAWKVAPYNAYIARPLYDAPLWIASKTWKRIGYVAVGTPCEDVTIRQTASTLYHYATNDKGQLGLAACQLTPL